MALGVTVGLDSGVEVGVSVGVVSGVGEGVVSGVGEGVVSGVGAGVGAGGGSETIVVFCRWSCFKVQLSIDPQVPLGVESLISITERNAIAHADMITKNTFISGGGVGVGCQLCVQVTTCSFLFHVESPIQSEIQGIDIRLAM